ncbi:hypothetical protein TRIP_B50385 [uncultured Desulfatiglans sp.]|uniref:Uncharacterized protein n=1 Tax=Uncultured Desulfatiglans sp. TaxID=1748965 RepID=A0A653AHQ1_UNCDX|nr:hypothetical protein TRIP_B50385 [uncultured Desulfatiglans sp.]
MRLFKEGRQVDAAGAQIWQMAFRSSCRGLQSRLRAAIPIIWNIWDQGRIRAADERFRALRNSGFEAVLPLWIPSDGGMQGWVITGTNGSRPCRGRMSTNTGSKSSTSCSTT